MDERKGWEEILKKMNLVTMNDMARIEKQLKSLDRRLKELKKELKKKRLILFVYFKQWNNLQTGSCQ